MPSGHTEQTNGRVADFDLIRDVKHLDLCIEFHCLPKCGVFFVNHHVAPTRHVVFVQALDVQAYVVSRIGKIDTLMVHFHGEDLASARVRCGVRWQKDNFFTGFYNTLLNPPCENITNALDFVDSRNGHPHWGTDWPLGNSAEFVKDGVEIVTMDSFFAYFDIHPLPPWHVVRLFQKVVAYPSRNWQIWCVLVNKFLLPPNLYKHVFHLICNLVITGLLITGNIAIHLVDTNTNLLHAKQIDQP